MLQITEIWSSFKLEIINNDLINQIKNLISNNIRIGNLKLLKGLLMLNRIFR